MSERLAQACRELGFHAELCQCAGKRARSWPCWVRGGPDKIPYNERLRSTAAPGGHSRTTRRGSDRHHPCHRKKAPAAALRQPTPVVSPPDWRWCWRLSPCWPVAMSAGWSATSAACGKGRLLQVERNRAAAGAVGANGRNSARCAAGSAQERRAGAAAKSAGPRTWLITETKTCWSSPSIALPMRATRRHWRRCRRRSPVAATRRPRLPVRKLLKAKSWPSGFERLVSAAWPSVSDGWARA